MHYADIIAELHKAGTKPVELAAEFDISRSAVSRVIHGDARSRRVAKRVSEIIGKPVAEIWPGKYNDKVAA